MKSLRLTASQTLALVETELPARPPAQHARVRISHITLNHLDVFGYRGMAFAQRTLPLTVGAEGAGTVVALGADVAAAWLGRPVAIYPGDFCGTCCQCRKGRENLCENSSGVMGFHRDGVAAEYVDVPVRMLVPAHPDLPLEFVACAPVTFSTVVHMLYGNAQLQKDESILVHAGGSGIGSTAIKFAKRTGATVFTTVGSAGKADKAAALGADHVINYRSERFLREVRSRTDRRGVDVVFEHVGTDTWAESVLALARGGRLVTCGSTSGVEASMNLFVLFNQQLRIFGSFGAPIADVAASLDAMHAGVSPVIDVVLPLARLEEGIERLRTRNVFGKVIINLRGQENR